MAFRRRRSRHGFGRRSRRHGTRIKSYGSSRGGIRL